MAAVVARADDVLAALPGIELGAQPLGSLFGSEAQRFEQLLPDYLVRQRWYAGKSHDLVSMRLTDTIPIGAADHLAMIDVRYADAPAELYALGVKATPARDIADLSTLLEPIGSVHAADGSFVLSDAMADPQFVKSLVNVTRGQRAVNGTAGVLTGTGGALDDAARSLDELSVQPLSLLTSNTSVKVSQPDGSAAVLKLVRRHDGELAPGTPTRALDVWKGSWLTDHTNFANTPRIYGSIEYTGANGIARTVSVLSEFAANDGDTWTHALDEVGSVLAAGRLAGLDDPAVQLGIERYAKAAGQHGRRLGELHVALTSGGAASEFRGVAPSAAQLQIERAALDASAGSTVDALRRARDLPGATPLLRAIDNDALEAVPAGVSQAADDLAASLAGSPAVERIHIHGDFHLGQMLKTGDDVQIIDLEGAPLLPIGERWNRASALGDVARQRSSYEYAAEQGLRVAGDQGATRTQLLQLRPIAQQWARRAQEAFLDEWAAATRGRPFVPEPAAFNQALRTADLSNALYETTYELGSRPDWVDIPLRRLLQLTAG